MPRKTRPQASAEEVVALYQKLEKTEQARFWELIQPDSPEHDDAVRYRNLSFLTDIAAVKMAALRLASFVIVTEETKGNNSTVAPLDEVTRRIYELMATVEYLGRFVRTPRNRERNLAIVNLRDGHRKLSFGQIGRNLMQLNPKWSRNGKPLSYATVKKAYLDTKGPLGLERPSRYRCICTYSLGTNAFVPIGLSE